MRIVRLINEAFQEVVSLCRSFTTLFVVCLVRDICHCRKETKERLKLIALFAASSHASSVSFFGLSPVFEPMSLVASTLFPEASTIPAKLMIQPRSPDPGNEVYISLLILNTFFHVNFWLH